MGTLMEVLMACSWWAVGAHTRRLRTLLLHMMLQQQHNMALLYSTVQHSTTLLHSIMQPQLNTHRLSRARQAGPLALHECDASTPLGVICCDSFCERVTIQPHSTGHHRTLIGNVELAQCLVFSCDSYCECVTL